MIVELQLKVQPSTLLEIKEQCTSAITMAIGEVHITIKDCIRLFEESFEVLTTLQEDPNIYFLEIEACELKQKYDEIKVTA